MFWSMALENPEPGPPAAPPCGRFVLHRHHDPDGPHLDLRLELDGCLAGWRIDAAALEDAAWAVAKPPHPLHWLEHDGDAVREDAGVYTWLDAPPGERRVALEGRRGSRILRFRREAGLAPRVARDVIRALETHAADPAQAAALIADGVAARRRAVERLCGLGRELDEGAFDETLWRRNLRACPLEELHGYLRAYEARFDRKYPPQPVSQPEPLPDDDGRARAERGLAVLRDIRDQTRAPRAPATQEE